MAFLFICFTYKYLVNFLFKNQLKLFSAFNISI